ncbi:Ger(x)C family spore germination protein [Dethiobacter alkaliphilus]|uniref:Germination protein, Ger(X)C family n=1 Tax=Dethiobacter alkaliphilus AHT 1 TaxID=555088 RepID=C0GEP5_DETAL|nr:Ger(x)C family spore germination protein [Dethiobacter alkaliphilus]EEG78077.1 germination protein, Ger(x)C family [Dethiobacter alkaliphilus AHT 1]
MIRLRQLITAILILTLPLFAGCWDQVEIEDLAVVRAIGLDYLPGRQSPYLVTLAIKRPAGIDEQGGAGGEPTIIYSGVGASVDLAIQQATNSMSKTIFLAHAEVYLVGEEAAKAGVSPFLDFIIRHPETRLNGFMLVTEGMAHDALQLTERMEESVSEEILSLIFTSQETSETEVDEVFIFLRQMATPGKDPHAGALTVKAPLAEQIANEDDEDENNDNDQEENGENEQDNGNGEENDTGNQEDDVHALEGIAVFAGDKLADILKYPESRGILWLTNNMRRSIMAVSDPVHPEHIVNISIARTATKITPVMENGEFSFRIEVDTEGDLESQSSETDLSKPEEIEKLNDALAGVIKEEMEKTLRRLQELQTDVMGLGMRLNRRHPQVYREVADRWPEEFSKVNVDIHVEANIRRTGQHSHTTRVNR